MRENGMRENGTRTVVVTLALALVAMGATACGAQSGSMEGTRMAGSDQVPAARGSVQTSMNDSGNTNLRVEVQHLAQPSEIEDGAQSYVVWVEPLEGGGEPQNVGALVVGPDLSGSLETITPLKQFDVYITPEENSTASRPTGPKVLETTVHSTR